MTFFQKSLKLNFDLCWIAEITLASSISVAHWQLIHQWKGLHEYSSMETSKFDFFFQKKIKIEFWRMLTSWNHLSFVNISPTLEIDTSMEMSSRVLQHAHRKCEFYKIKVAKARKISFVRETAFSEVIYRGSVAVHFRCSLSTMVATSLPCSRRISFNRLLIIPWCQGKKFRLSCL